MSSTLTTRWTLQVVSYNKRHLAQEEKAKQDKGSKSYKSLKNWGHDAQKTWNRLSENSCTNPRRVNGPVKVTEVSFQWPHTESTRLESSVFYYGRRGPSLFYINRKLNWNVFEIYTRHVFPFIDGTKWFAKHCLTHFQIVLLFSRQSSLYILDILDISDTLDALETMDTLDSLDPVEPLDSLDTLWPSLLSPQRGRLK